MPRLRVVGVQVIAALACRARLDGRSLLVGGVLYLLYLGLVGLAPAGLLPIG